MRAGSTALAVVALLVVLVSGTRARSIDVVPFDSGTRVVREVAEALTGTGRSILECYPPGSELFLGLVSLLPERARIAVIDWGMRLSLGENPDRAAEVSAEDLADWCVSQYPAHDVRYPAIVIGSPNGAVAHLAALLGAPFLTTSFGLAFRHETIEADDLNAYTDFASAAAAGIVAANPGTDFEVACHYDPIHDRSMVEVVSFLRIKLHEVPPAYEEFIRDTLAPGGKLILVDCGYEWPQIPLGERVFLQIGGLGAVTPEAYLAEQSIGSPLLRRESEWGCPTPFADAVRALGSNHDFTVLEIHFDHPGGYSALAYEAYLSCRSVRSEMLLIDTFNHQNPRTNLETGIPALWLPFNTLDALDIIDEALGGTDLETILLAPLPSFAQADDTTSLETWEETLLPYGSVEIIGTRAGKFPADPLGPYRLSRDLRRLRRTLQLPEPIRLDPADLESLLAPAVPAP